MGIKHFFCLVLIAFAFLSCKSRQDPVDELKQLVEEVQTYRGQFSDADWELIDARHEAITTEIANYTTEYTPEESRYIGQLEGRYLYYYGQYAAKQTGTMLRNLFHETRGVLEGVVDEAEQNVEEESESNE